MSRTPEIAAADQPRHAAPPETPEWQGDFTPYVVGDPGRAASRVRPALVADFPDRPDTILDGIVVNGPDGAPSATVRAASVRGLSHRHYARVRQDDYALRVTPDSRYLVVCVADGVSSGDLSHFAALWAAQDGTDELCQRLARNGPDELPWPEFLAWVADRIVERAGHQVEGIGSDPREVAQRMAAALTYAVMDLTGEERAVHLLTVGDTSGWVLGRDGDWRPQQPVKNADVDIHSSAVSALPILSGTPRPVRTSVAPGEALVVMTDGIGDPLGNGSGAVGRFLARSWGDPPADFAFAAQVGFARRSFDDDRTAVAVWPTVTRG